MVAEVVARDTHLSMVRRRSPLPSSQSGCAFRSSTAVLQSSAVVLQSRLPVSPGPSTVGACSGTAQHSTAHIPTPEGARWLLFVKAQLYMRPSLLAHACERAEHSC